MLDEPPGTCEPVGTHCDKWRISRRYRFIWHHVWKGGTTSLSPYLSCNMYALPVAGLLRRLPAPPPGYLHVGTAREPLKRFLSAFQEVYARVRVRSSSSSSSTPGGEGTRCWHRRVPWLLVAMTRAAEPHPEVCAEADTALDAPSLRAVFRQFIADVECGTRFANGEHLYSQALFLGGNTSTPQPIDLLLRLESLETDLQTLKRAVGYAEPVDACPLRTERVASEKPRAVPASYALRSLLRDEPELLQSVCNVYMQDYICLGYPLPEGCRLLPSRAAQPPSTMNITPRALHGYGPQRARRRGGAGGVGEPGPGRATASPRARGYGNQLPGTGS